MTDLRRRFADAIQQELDEHGYEDDDDKRWQVSYHFADVLLSMPGIEIVALPDRTDIPTYWNEECLGAWPAGHPDPVSAWPQGEVALPNGDFLSAAEARALGIALLAASEAAERDTTDG